MKALIILTVWVILTVRSTRLKRYNWNILIALDQLANTALFGHPDETFSARTYRKTLAGQRFWRVLRVVIDLAFRWESAEHCREAYENELKRTQGPREYQHSQHLYRSPTSSSSRRHRRHLKVSE